MKKIVFVRHGQSEWNKLKKFTGWTDVNLTEKGIEESEECGKLLRKNKLKFDLAFSSVLKRSTMTLGLILEQMGLSDIEIKKSWRLNERFYGALQGLNKLEVAKKEGSEQIQQWRRSYRVKPPKINKDDPRYPGKNEMYSNLTEDELPVTESLEDVVKRVRPFFEKTILPKVEGDKKILIVAHHNSIRAMIKLIQKTHYEQMINIEIPTGFPLVYELQNNTAYIKHYFLGDKKEIQKRLNENNVIKF